jgi:biotin operon repressor
MLIYDVLQTGGENATSRSELVMMTGLSEREVRRKIAMERQKGFLILSSTENGGGYFKLNPENPEELRRFIASMTSRGRKIFTALNAARSALAKIERNEIEGAGDGKG